MTILFTEPSFVPVSGNSVVYPGAKLYFYATETSTPQNTYSEYTLTTAHANPVVADADGRFAPIYLDPSLEDYKVVLKDSSDVTIWTVDPYSAVNNTTALATMSALLSASTALGTVSTNGYHSAGDGGGGNWYWDGTKDRALHNGATVVDPTRPFPSDWTNQTQVAAWFTAGTGTGCWIRIYSAPFVPEMAGAKGDGATNDYLALKQAVNLGVLTIELTKDYLTASMIELPSNIHLRFSGGNISFSGSMASASIFYATNKTNIVIEGAIATGDTSIASNDTHYGSFAYFDTCTDVHIRNNTISTFPQTSVAFVDCTDCSFAGNKVTGISSPTNVSAVCGLNIEDACVNTRISRNYFTNIGNGASDYQGLGIRVIKQTTTMPTRTIITNNSIKDCTEHGIVIYDGTTNAANNDPGTVINDNVIKNTGTASTAGGAGTNTRGNGIYCLGFVPGSIVGNTIENANTNSTSTLIADAGIAVMIGTGATQPQTSLIIDSAVNGANAGIELQNIAGFSLKGSFKGIANKGLEIGQCSDYSVDVSVSSTTSTDIAINMNAPSSGCDNFHVNAVVTGFGTSMALSSASHGSITLMARDYSTRGLIYTACDNIEATLKTETTSDLPSFVSAGASTDCHVILRSSDRPGGDAPNVSNAGTGVIVETWGSAVPPTGGTWAVGDKVTLRTPTASNPDYARCVTAGTVGTWKTGGNLSA